MEPEQTSDSLHATLAVLLDDRIPFYTIDATAVDYFPFHDTITDPALVEHIVNGYFGGVGSTVNRVAQLAKHADEMSPKEAITSNWMPIVRTQHYSPNERTRYARTRNKWWYYKEEADKRAREIITTAIQRYASDQVTETTVSVVSLHFLLVKLATIEVSAVTLV